MTSRTSWKGTERHIAHLFGTERTPLSGGNSRHTRSDSLSEKLYIEVKFRASLGDFFKAETVTMLAEAIERAQIEGKVPILALHEKGRANSENLFIVRECDLVAFAEEILKWQGSKEE